MGCNSHLSIEILRRWANTAQWDTWALDIPESRDYALYEAMAGVRGEKANAVVRPRGIPKDLSDTVKYWIDRAGDDGHSHSWLYPSEFHRAIKQANAEDDKIWKSIHGVLTTLQMIWEDENVRLVFFFDN